MIKSIISTDAARGQAAIDIATFCRIHSISRATFYRLVRRGRGPKLMKVGSRTRISTEAIAEWRARMESA